MRLGRWALAFGLALFWAGAQPVSAQFLSDFAPGNRTQGVLIVDQEKLFNESAFGRETTARVEAAAAELAQENRQIEADLTREELALTEARPTLQPEEFRKRAADFDRRVVAIRAEQDEKTREVVLLRETSRQEFFQKVFPVVAEVARERGALVVLDARSVVLSADAIDITQAVIERLDAALAGDGGGDTPTDP